MTRDINISLNHIGQNIFEQIYKICSCISINIGMSKITMKIIYTPIYMVEIKNNF